MTIFILFVWTMASPDPYRVGSYETMNACRYDLPKVVEWMEREGQTHIAAGCKAVPLAPLTSIRPQVRE